LTESVDNSFYFINLKELLSFIYELESPKFDQSYKKAAEYFIDCADAVFGYTDYSEKYNTQTFTVKQQKSLNLLELYNIFNQSEQENNNSK